MSGKSELKIFDHIPPQVVMESGVFEDVHPSATIENSNVIEFNIAPSEVDYLDLHETVMRIGVQFVDKDNANLTVAASPTPVNYLMNSLFSDITLSLNDIIIEGGSQSYDYKAMIEDNLNFSEDCKKTKLRAKGYEKDDATRAKMTDASKICELIGNIRLDFFTQTQYLIPGVRVRIIFTLNNVAKSIFSRAFLADKTKAENKIEEDSIKIKYSNPIIYIRRVKVVPSITQAHNLGLNTMNAIYPYTRTKVVQFQIPKGVNTYFKDRIFSSSILPKFVVIGMIKSISQKDVQNYNNYFFDHFNLRSLSLHRNGQSLPFRRAYKPDFTPTTGMYADTYFRSIIMNLGLLNSEYNNGITMDDFANHGCCFFTFNLTPDFDIKTSQPLQDANLRLDFDFAVTTPTTINVVAYAAYDSELQITKDRDILTDAHS